MQSGGVRLADMSARAKRPLRVPWCLGGWVMQGLLDEYPGGRLRVAAEEVLRQLTQTVLVSRCVRGSAVTACNRRRHRPSTVASVMLTAGRYLTCSQVEMEAEEEEGRLTAAGRQAIEGKALRGLARALVE